MTTVYALLVTVGVAVCLEIPRDVDQAQTETYEQGYDVTHYDSDIGDDVTRYDADISDFIERSIYSNSSTRARSNVVKSKHFRRAFQSGLEHIFGMKNPPKGRDSVRTNVPQFMMDLYKTNIVDSQTLTTSADTTARRKRHSYLSANTIRSFVNEGRITNFA